MTDQLETVVRAACEACDHDRTRLLDIALRIQQELSCVSPDAIDKIAEELGIPRVDVQGLVGFYSFLSETRKGRIVIRLCDDIVDRLQGYDEVRKAFESELGIGLGQTTEDEAFSFERTACIGMSDQAPAALIGDVVVTHLTADRAKQIVRELREHADPQKLVTEYGDGQNENPLVRSMVRNNLRKPGPLIFSEIHRGEAIRKALRVTPQEAIRAVKTARLRGRGGAGFPTGIKWEYTRAADGDQKFVLCNADEGEPGTFKDRVILTEIPDRLFAGMTIAGYAIGAREGILYLRGEYRYLQSYLEDVLQKRRADGLLGHAICGTEDFDFDIRIQIGAGAYVCGEETALISSCEGLRGDPKNRPPFPAQEGYLGKPTVVNNVETLCCVTKIFEEGAASFSSHGAPQNTGTKLISVSGDVKRPGVYELPFGITIAAVLELAGAEDTVAVSVGGPSGTMLAPSDFERTLSYDDIPTGGSFIVFGNGRDVLSVVRAFMEFFVDESCGYCTPCRAGNVLLLQGLVRLLSGRGDREGLEVLRRLAETVKKTSRCGLGQSSPNPILSSLAKFPELYEALVHDDDDGVKRSFDLESELSDAEAIQGRRPGHS